MSSYQGRSLQGENMMRTVYFDHPEWTPVSAGFLPAAWAKYGEALDDLILRHSRMFPNYQKPEKREPPVMEGLMAAGRIKDCWGCVWENLHPGIIGQVVDHPLADWAAFDTWKQPDPMKDSLLGPRNWEWLAEWVRVTKEQGHFCPAIVLTHGHHYLLMCDIRGFENAMIDMITDEPMLHKLLDVIINFNSAVTKKHLDLDCEFIGYGEDLGTQKALPISLDLWRKFVKPGYEATAGQARDRDIPVFLHSDGHILPIIGDLIETGVRMLNPQVRANGLDGLKEVAKGKVAIALDLDRQLFPFATPDQLVNHVQECYDALYMPEGGLMFNVEIGEDVPLENMDTLFSAIERICKLPDPDTRGNTSSGF
ncbi:MAG: uroporphyrinogen decarboxylase family protein [Armatimonadota bacterium]